MKKAKANVTLMIRNKIRVTKGTVFTPPYPEYIQAEIDAYKGKANPTISEFEVADPMTAPVEKPVEPIEPIKEPELVDSLEEPEPSEDELMAPADTIEGFEVEVLQDSYPEAEEVDPDLSTAQAEVDRAPEESEADKKKRLITYAKETFGVKIDGRKSLPDIEAQIDKLQADDAASTESEEEDLNTI